jgi:hypothetical protein
MVGLCTCVPGWSVEHRGYVWLETKYQKVLFTARGLAPGLHTLSIEVMHTRDVNGSGSWVWIDGFDVENGAGVSGGTSAPTAAWSKTAQR